MIIHFKGRLVIKALFSSVVQIVEWILRYEDYKEHLVDQAALMLTISGRVSETTQILTTQFNFRLRTPDLIIIVSFLYYELFICTSVSVCIQVFTQLISYMKHQNLQTSA